MEDRRSIEGSAPSLRLTDGPCAKSGKNAPNLENISGIPRSTVPDFANAIHRLKMEGKWRKGNGDAEYGVIREAGG
jgi:hypothetical protein